MTTRVRARPGMLRPRAWAVPMLFWLGTALAAPPAAHPLQSGLEAAWALQPEQRSSALRRAADDAALQSAGRWTAGPPSLELSTRTDRPVRNDGAREVDATLSVPLWRPGERAGARAAAEAQAASLVPRMEAARWRLAEQVRSAYWEHARAALGLQLADERLRHARLLADDVARRVKAGDLARADAHQADGATEAAAGALHEARAAATRTARRWQALTGLDAPSPGPAPSESLPARAPVDVSGHPVLRELAARVELARRQRELAERRRAEPIELSIGAARERGGAGERSAGSVVVGVRIPLGAGSDSAVRVATASAEQAEAEAALSTETRRVQVEADAARDEVAALQSASAAADRRAALAIESRGFFTRSFRLGETDLPTRLRIELEAFEAERQAARARVDLGAAISTLRQALGLLPAAPGIAAGPTPSPLP